MGSDRIRQEVEKWRKATSEGDCRWDIRPACLDDLIARLTVAWEEERLHWQQIHTGCHAEREELQAQVAALVKYVRHWQGAGEHGCNIHRPAKTDGECSCGLRALLATGRDGGK